MTAAEVLAHPWLASLRRSDTPPAPHPRLTLPPLSPHLQQARSPREHAAPMTMPQGLEHALWGPAAGQGQRKKKGRTFADVVAWLHDQPHPAGVVERPTSPGGVSRAGVGAESRPRGVVSLQTALASINECGADSGSSAFTCLIPELQSATSAGLGAGKGGGALTTATRPSAGGSIYHTTPLPHSLPLPKGPPPLPEPPQPGLYDTFPMQLSSLPLASALSPPTVLSGFDTAYLNP